MFWNGKVTLPNLRMSQWWGYFLIQRKADSTDNTHQNNDNYTIHDKFRWDRIQKKTYASSRNIIHCHFFFLQISSVCQRNLIVILWHKPCFLCCKQVSQSASNTTLIKNLCPAVTHVKYNGSHFGPEPDFAIILVDSDHYTAEKAVFF